MSAAGLSFLVSSHVSGRADVLLPSTVPANFPSFKAKEIAVFFLFS